MKVYKFGGASVKDAESIRNVTQILSQENGELVVVVSAMGKTTNALEAILADLCAGKDKEGEDKWTKLLEYHFQILRDLGFDDDACRQLLRVVEDAAPNKLRKDYLEKPASYEQFYDSFVSLGERLSSTIVASYLKHCGINVVLWDITKLLRTDNTFREAVVDMPESESLIKKAWKVAQGQGIVVTQGFIGGTKNGLPTTLGREGSDYTAAIIGNILDAESVTIWKDVPGILNADPRLVRETTKIDELSYNDAVELAYSGAQIIHPKTIRPLENKHIPLFVKPFNDATATGSVIKDNAKAICVPVFIWRKNQVLITMRAKDFSFVLEESLSHIFDIIKKYRLRVSLIQSSAVTISVCVDNTRYVQQAIRTLTDNYKVSWNENLSLLTIRGTTPEILQHEKQGRTILLTQTTRRTARLIIKEDNL